MPLLKKNLRLREGFKERTSAEHLKRADIWIQGASAGESNLAVQLVKKFDSKTIIKEPASINSYPKQPPKILLTSTTVQGISSLFQTTKLLSNQSDSINITNITWFPFDIPDLMESVICKVTPALIVLIETELWPSLLFAAKKYDVKVVVVNGRLSKKSHRNYMLTRWLWKLIQPNQILAISEKDAQRFRDIFPNSQIDVMPNMKFDTLLADNRSLNVALPSNIKVRQTVKELPFIKESPYLKVLPTIKELPTFDLFPPDIPISILASVRKEEEDDVIIIIDELFKLFPKQIICLFPRHQHRIDFWKKALTEKNQTWVLRSELKLFIYIDNETDNETDNEIDNETDKKTNKETDNEVFSNKSRINSLSLGTVILWDIFGELRHAYSLGTVAFVGGSLKPLGGHNFIEPLVAGVATVTGPFTEDFSWVGEELFSNNTILDNSMVKRATHRDDVINFMVKTLTNPPNKRYIIEKSLEYIEKKQGGTSIVCNTINHYIKKHYI